MTLKLYDTYTRKIRDFKSIQKNKITMYNCGPTVYDFVHIGNYRTYLMADFIRRTFEYFDYDVKQIKNITDVGHLTQDDIEAGEDKMLKAAKRENKNPYDIARFYENVFFADEKKLNILPAYKFTRATEYINEMIAMIEKLIENGYAYKSNGNVFFAVEKFEKYGKLSGNTLENLKTGSRLESHPDKRDSHDFALWLKASPDHLMQWDSPWSKGYPGWHIECSAMSTANLGNTIDIHTGGEDNIFPHHEDEIAQSEGATGKKFVNYWLHGRHLLVDGEKMSKSKGNFYKLSDIEEKKLNILSFRYLCLTTHFQSQLNFTWQSLEASQNALNKLYEFIRLSQKNNGTIIKEYETKFKNSLKNNIDTPKALALTWEMIKSKEYNIEDKKATLIQFDKVFGFNLNNPPKENEIPAEIEKLIEQRKKAREDKNWTLSDELRDEIDLKGFILKDTPQGIVIKSK